MTHEQVIEAMTRVNSELQRYYQRLAYYLIFGFASGFLVGVSVALMLTR